MNGEWGFKNPEDPNHPAQYDRLPDDQKQLLQDWIANRIKSASAYLHKRTSYGLKHDFQWDTGLYVNNGAFKGGMMAAGYKPDSGNEMNPSYKIRPIARIKRGQGRPVYGWWAKGKGVQINYGADGKASLVSMSVEPVE